MSGAGPTFLYWQWSNSHSGSPTQVCISPFSTTAHPVLRVTGAGTDPGYHRAKKGYTLDKFPVHQRAYTVCGDKQAVTQIFFFFFLLDLLSATSTVV